MSFYTVLGVAQDATQDEIKKAYKNKALTCHPDKVEPSAREKSEETFKSLLEAFETLSDIRKRRLYDLSNGVDFPTLEQSHSTHTTSNPTNSNINRYAPVFYNSGPSNFWGGRKFTAYNS